MGNKKKLEKYDKLLQKLKTKREIVKIGRTVREGESNIYGLILNFSDELMQIAENDEFKFNGELIIRMDHYDSVRCNEFDKTIKRILKGEKNLNKSKPKASAIDLSNWNTAFKDLQKLDLHVIIECEDLKKPSFTIGPVVKVNNKSVEIQNYDATGRLDKETTKVKFKNITLLKFNDEYSTTFRKYLVDGANK